MSHQAVRLNRVATTPRLRRPRIVCYEGRAAQKSMHTAIPMERTEASQSDHSWLRSQLVVVVVVPIIVAAVDAGSKARQECSQLPSLNTAEPSTRSDNGCHSHRRPGNIWTPFPFCLNGCSRLGPFNSAGSPMAIRSPPLRLVEYRNCAGGLLIAGQTLRIQRLRIHFIINRLIR